MVEDWKTHDVFEEYTLTRIAYISRRFSNLIITIYAMSVFLYAAGTLLRYKSSNQTDARELILKMELPFEIKSTSVYIAVLVTQFVHQTSAASMVGVLNCLLITLVSLFYTLSMFLQRNITTDMTPMKKVLSKIK